MDNIIKTILYEWKERKLPITIKRDINLDKYLSLKVSKIITITGFRRVGKTYLILGLIKKLLKKHNKEEVVYINFEDERIPKTTEFLTNLIPLIKETYSHNIKYLFLDEIQNIPNWSQWVRRIYDQEDIRIFITGSSSKLSSREISTELRGRCIEVMVRPLSFKEFLIFKNLKIDLASVSYSSNLQAVIRKALNEYLYYGGLPEVVLSREEERFEILQQYYRTVISQDIVERFRIKNEEALKRLLLLLLNSLSYSVNKLYNTLKSMNYKIGTTTLLNYISYIESSYFLSNLFIFSYKIKDQLQYPKKVYFVDNGFISALSSSFSRNMGRLYENLVFNELQRKLKINANIFYWKDKKLREVDFVVREDLKIKKLIQVSYDLSDLDTKNREIKSLLKASDELKCNELLIINQDYEGEEKIKGKKIKFIPLYKFLLE